MNHAVETPNPAAPNPTTVGEELMTEQNICNKGPCAEVILEFLGFTQLTQISYQMKQGYMGTLHANLPEMGQV